MLFNSYPFLFLYLPVTLLVFFWAAKSSRRLAATWLAAASLVFYSIWNPAYLLLLILSIFFNYSVGIGLTRFFDSGQKQKLKQLLLVGVAINLLLLGYYKYFGFFIDSLNAVTALDIKINQIILPLGISFFTFTQIAFLVDASKGLARELNFIHYVLFVTYFPHLIAGPVLHHKEMMPQFASPATYRIDLSNIAVGFAIFAIGLFKKVVFADGIAPYVSPGFSAAAGGAPLPFFDAWGCALAYTFQIYFDFSGYTDMAIGLSRLFGVRLPLNFNSPYKSESIIEFWRRWHMTLSRFLRDYLYIPLGGNRLGSVRRYLNLFTTMLLGGLWHGAGWTFIIWGVLHGLYLVVNHAWQGIEPLLPVRMGRRAGTILTFLAVVVGWVFFRAENVTAAMSILNGMIGRNGFTLPAFILSIHPFMEEMFKSLGIGASLGGGTRFISTYLWITGLALIAFFFPNTQEIIPGMVSMVKKDNTPQEKTSLASRFTWSPSKSWAIGLGLVTATGILAMNQVSEFLYFQF